jgi:hypothetical protein
MPNVIYKGKNQQCKTLPSTTPLQTASSPRPAPPSSLPSPRRATRRRGDSPARRSPRHSRRAACPTETTWCSSGSSPSYSSWDLTVPLLLTRPLLPGHLHHLPRRQLPPHHLHRRQRYQPVREGPHQIGLLRSVRVVPGGGPERPGRGSATGAEDRDLAQFVLVG